MRVKLKRHRDKIAVFTEQTSDSTRLGTLLRSTVDDPNSVVAIRGGYLIPFSSINLLFEILPPEIHGWDKELQNSVIAKNKTTGAQLSAKIEVAQALESPYDALRDYGDILQLDRHQVDAVAAMTVPSLRGMALLDEQGVGKTACALVAFDVLHRRGEVSHLIVVAPKSVLSVWENECNRLFCDKYSVRVASGKQAKPYQMLRGEFDIMLINYDAITRGVLMLQGLASTKGREFMLVVDESYYVKNPTAQRSRAVAQLRQRCKRAYILCGAPAPNSPVDIVNQMDIADAGTTFKDVKIPKDEDSAMLVIKQALGDSAIYLRRLKREVLPSLPKKNIKRTLIELQPIQKELYEGALQNLVIDVQRADDTYFSKHLGEFMSRKWTLLRVCSNPAGIDGKYSEIPAKQIALDQILKDIVAHRGLKIVIWSFFRYSLNSIVDRYSHYGLVKIDGSVDSVAERNIAIQRFQEDPSIMVFVGNPAAAGAGITLTAASHAVYESFSNQPAHYLQSVDRIHRRGQQKPVTSFILISQSTIEERELNRLLEKERRGHGIFDKKPTAPVTREGFLKDLLGD